MIVQPSSHHVVDQFCRIFEPSSVSSQISPPFADSLPDTLGRLVADSRQKVHEPFAISTSGFMGLECVAEEVERDMLVPVTPPCGYRSPRLPPRLSPEGSYQSPPAPFGSCRACHPEGSVEVHSNHASHMRLLSERNDGSGGRHDKYGFALTTQPGESQRRPATNTSSRRIVWIALPAPSCGDGGTRRSQRMARPSWNPQPDIGTENLHTG